MGDAARNLAAEALGIARDPILHVALAFALALAVRAFVLSLPEPQDEAPPLVADHAHHPLSHHRGD